MGTASTLMVTISAPLGVRDRKKDIPVIVTVKKAGGGGECLNIYQCVAQS